MDVFTMSRWDDFVQASMATGEDGSYGVSFFLPEEFRQWEYVVGSSEGLLQFIMPLSIIGHLDAE